METKTTTTRKWAVEQSASTRRALILAAIPLMADGGIDGVSLRSINVAAGAANASAAHYHFGSKLGLIEAIVDSLSQDVAAIRGPLLERLRKKPATGRRAVREIIDAAFLPFMGLIFHADYGLPAIRFLSRLIVDTGPEIRVVVNRFTEPLAGEVYDLLSDALPAIPDRVLKMRILFSLTNLINGMSDMAAMERSPFGDLSTPGSLEGADHFLDYIAAGISSPVVSTLDECFSATAQGVIAAYQDRSQGE